MVEMLTNHQTQPRPPMWFMRQAGRYLPEYRKIRSDVPNFLSLCYTPDLAAEVTLQPIRRFDLDAAIVFADILLIPDALGQTVTYVEGEGPRLAPVVRSISDVERLQRRGVSDHLKPVYSTLSQVRSSLPSDKTLIGFAGAPWTVAVYMVEGGSSSQFMAARSWSASRPDEFAELIELLVVATIDYVDQQVAAGADVIQLFDTWAGLLPPPGFQRWCVEPVAKIVRGLRVRHPDIPVIAFPRGAGTMLHKYDQATGVNGISLDPTITPEWACEVLGRSTVLQGNLDPAVLVAGGEVLEQEAHRILEAFAATPHVFNLGHGIVPETPPDNVAQLSEIVRSWQRSGR